MFNLKAWSNTDLMLE
jgi:hypothetical protein